MSSSVAMGESPLSSSVPISLEPSSWSEDSQVTLTFGAILSEVRDGVATDCRGLQIAGWRCSGKSEWATHNEGVVNLTPVDWCEGKSLCFVDTDKVELKSDASTVVPSCG